MKIDLNKKQLKINLYFGITFIALGMLSYLMAPNALFFYGFIPMGLVYFSSYFYNKRKGYAIFSDEKIKKQGLFGKEIKLSNLTKARYFAGDFIFADNETEIVLNEKLINEQSSDYLKQQIEIIQFKINQIEALK